LVLASVGQTYISLEHIIDYTKVSASTMVGKLTNIAAGCNQPSLW